MDNVSLTMGRPATLTVAGGPISVRLDDAVLTKFDTDGNGRFTAAGTYAKAASVPPPSGVPADENADDDGGCDCCEGGYVEQLEAEVDTLKQMHAEERKRAEAFRTTLIDRVELNDKLGQENARLRKMVDDLTARIAAQSDLLSQRAERGNG